ncbi:MAG: M24 family metallopeptidase [Bacillati bacterium ANGP1]|uniref:M24 family metallopeptidase n=1 Tax=Candidatus Segetimicrobium genomatis TaxID=2569760 RepID=A0A537JEF4_9BACT|nr:MAG: M24 family metallopeptidase [Terrabacteria group bacterium ANGP1]
MTGFTGSAGLALISPAEAFLAVDFRYEEQAAAEATACTVLRGGRDPLAALSAAVAGRSLRTIGFESEFVPFAQVTRLREKLAPAELVPLATVDRLRWTKDATEVAAITRAVEIADAAFAHILGVLRPGLSERAVAFELEMFMRRSGAERLAFESVVASGPRAALPHGRATDRMLCRGDLVTLDFGAVYEGYCSDATRTVVLGAADDRQRRIFEIVLAAQAQSPRRASATRSGTRSATAWAWRCTKGPAFRRRRTPSSNPGWSSPSSPGSTSRAGAACGSRTTW